jgi:hypothetical protein
MVYKRKLEEQSQGNKFADPMCHLLQKPMPVLIQDKGQKKEKKEEY